MKPINPVVSTAIRQSHNINAIPRLTVEWNMNRYANVVADNIPAEDTDGYDPEMFPIESIYQPNRPTRGINKARLGEARLRTPYEGNQPKRFYVATPDSVYKYWTSPVETTGTTFPAATDGRTKARPHVLYSPAVQGNKIVIKLENSWASPSSFQVLVKSSSGAAWNYTSPTVSNPTIDPNGQITLYHQGGGIWSTNASGSHPLTTVGGIMLKVDSMNATNSYLSVIEISLRREEDLTSYLISTEDTFDISEPSEIYPIGTISSNTASLTLSNVDGIFNNQNSLSSYYGLIEPNVRFNLEYIYKINGVDYPVQQFEMYSEEWNGQSNDTVEVSLVDYSKYLQDVMPEPAMYENLTASEIIWRLLDQVGFNNYIVSVDNQASQPIVNIFWADGEKTVWELLDELARATQTAIYFDGYGRLRVKPRTTAFNEAQSPSWTLRGNVSGSDLSDIISLEQESVIGSNHVTVNYQTTEWSESTTGFPKLDRVWEPEGTLTLRASPLVQTLGTNDSFVLIPAQDAIHWPFNGILQIQGELIRYSGKQYSYYEGGVRKTGVARSQDDVERFDALTPDTIRYQNSFTGRLEIEERGLWNSETKRHPVEAEGYVTRNYVNGVRRTGIAGFAQNRNSSTVTVSSNKQYSKVQDILMAVRGNATDTAFRFFGTRLKINNEDRWSDRAGIVMHNSNTSEDGYYVEIMPSSKVDRARENEVTIFSHKGGTSRRFGGEGSQGVAHAIAHNVYYDIDVSIVPTFGNHRVVVMINGRRVMTADIPPEWQHNLGGRFGMHVRGDTSATYEYIYAIARLDDQLNSDTSTFYDRITGGYSGNQWDREWVFKWHQLTRRQKRKTTRERQRWNNMLMDEFGPYVHEVREFDVQFDPFPVLHSRIMVTNEANIVCPEFSSTSFGAKFLLANASRRDAVSHGDQALSGDNTISHLTVVYGRVAIIRESESVEIKNDAQIRARGIVETEITSDWIQSKDSAEKLAQWISSHWSKGLDTVRVTIFGNPLIELSDVVSVVYPQLDMDAVNHRYFVTGISTNFQNGLETTLTLRRVP